MSRNDDKGEAANEHEHARWRVLKFGGTSVASAERWNAIARIVRERIEAGLSVVLVCSAVAGVTDLLASLVRAQRKNDPVDPLLRELRETHERLASDLQVPLDVIRPGLERLEGLANTGIADARTEAEVMSFGELLCTRLGAAWLSSQGVGSAWVDARELLQSTPSDTSRLEHYLSASCQTAPSAACRDRVARLNEPVIVTQGYIARSPEGETVLLGRGGSDTSAAYLACLLSAERLEIWTDVPGLFTANPRMVADARLLRHVGYREAQALGALGAKVLHPRAIEAVWEHGIPVQIGWTERPDLDGTCINAARARRGVKAITSRRRLAMFALRRPPSWQPVGFLADVATCFANRGLSMDLVSSSCSEIRVTVDLDAFPSAEDEIPSILHELEATCQPRVVKPVASVSAVGDRVGQALLGGENAYGLFADEALFMVVHAADEHHVSFVLEPDAAERLVSSAHDSLLAEQDRHDLGATWAELNEPGVTSAQKSNAA
jgi:diaminopimelate decarboxylase/aspartate kinase